MEKSGNGYDYSDAEVLTRPGTNRA